MNPRLAVTAATSTLLIGSFAGTAAAYPYSHKPVVFHKSSSGMTIAVKEGKTFKVSLQACGDCGDHWAYKHRPASAVLEQIGTPKTVSEAPPGAVGGNNHKVWTFKAVGQGKTTMRMVERTARDHNKVIGHFTLTVEVA